MTKVNIVKKLEKLLIKILCCICLSIICFLIALLISHIFTIELSTIILSEGFILILIGAFISPSGKSSSINLNALGQHDANLISNQDLQVTRLEQQFERESADYYKNYFQKSVKGVFKSNITLILTGIILILYALNLY